MSLSVRGRTTGLSGVPPHWRGPLPDVSVRRDLDPLDGYAQVPKELLFGGHADLGVLTWTWLRLRSDDRAEVASYQQFANALGYGHLTDRAVQKRFSAALSSLLDEEAPQGGWIVRERTLDNQQLYKAVVPAKAGKRYAMLRRCDLARLLLPAVSKKAEPVSVADLANFGRWQLECGQRAWTADPLSVIAARWEMGEATVWRSRVRLEAQGFLEVTDRPGGRYPDLVWLRELHDPHWQVASTAWDVDQPAPPRQEDQGPEVSSTSGGSSLSDLGGPFFQKRGGESFSDGGSYKRNLTGGSLTEDLSELGGASATPLTLLPRGMGDAAPQAAARAKDRSSAPRSTVDPLQSDGPRSQLADEPARKVAGRLLAQHRHLSSAPRHYVKAMVKLLAHDLDRGLHPGHIARALERCVTDGEVVTHCELVRLAVRQAWGDQRAGACGECGADVGEHRMGCADRAAEVDASVNEEEAAKIRAAVLASLESARDSGAFLEVGRQVEAAPTQPPDPLAGYLSEPLEPDWSVADDGEVASWLTTRMAVAVADAPDRPAALQKVWRLWRSQVAPQHLDLVDAAAAYLRLVLEERRAS